MRYFVQNGREFLTAGHLVIFNPVRITVTKQLHSNLFHKVVVLPAQFFLTLSNSTFLRAESTNLEPHLAIS